VRAVDSRAATEQLTTAFDNYFAMSEILRDDLIAALNVEDESPAWRRNFLRATVVLVEGHTHCLREICLVGLACNPPEISDKETRALRSEKEFSAIDRFKYTLRATYKIFALQPTPDFGDIHWARATMALRKRDSLIHPKYPTDLEIPAELWSEIHAGITWLMKQLFNFTALLQEKYLSA
jgi:hypothetical protein